MTSIALTLPDLLLSRSHESTAVIGHLDFDGRVVKATSYAKLFDDAENTSRRLLASGLKSGADIVIACFPDHESHIRLFWACCLAGIPVCPIPSLHPDPSRQALFFKHLQDLFHQPTLIAHEHTIAQAKDVAPDIRALTLADLDALRVDDMTRASVFPARVPSPDDIVCLMLTSGSTGNSKAVALRHSNLLSSVRGKIKHHNTTSSSRFLNWIAFDHVACVSEAHLQALEANARKVQYHVAPSAVIQQPRNLLRWCSDLGVTYSFSPNFLIAQICRDVASRPFTDESPNLSSMCAFISGGEAVPVKTAIEFSNLIEQLGGPRNALRAGFGMSETGAGCTYDTRPVVYDPSACIEKYLSLGRCCEGVSVRVIDPSSGSVCAAGETGQLQLSGPTVFREYYNNKEATDESFSSDGWFITGDSAQLDGEGNLHLVGRDKDVIIINGVKYPCVDVEHFVEDSTTEGVMKSFIYVCPTRRPNSDTETYAVFYQHRIRVEDDLTKEDLLAIHQTNGEIRNACIALCSQAPHIILPLPRQFFTKTALGKVSRAALIKSYLQGSHDDLERKLQSVNIPSQCERATPRNAVDDAVFEAVALTFDVDVTHIERSQTLFELGASSMHLIRLKHVLQDHFKIQDIHTIEFLRRSEIGQLCDYVNEIIETRHTSPSSSPPSYRPLTCLEARGTKPPLFLVHPGVGEILVFIQLARVLDDDRPVFALRARGFDDGESTFGSFTEMVDAYTSAIEESYPEGPYFIAGYSFGGAVAFEIGKKLESKGKHVAWIGILNLPPHIQFRMKELTWTEVLVNIFMFLSLITTDAFDAVKDDLRKNFPACSLSDEEPESAESVINWLFKRADQSRLQSLKLDSGELCRWTRVAYDMSRLGRTYEPSGAVQGALTTIFCAIPLPAMGNRHQYKHNHLSAWTNFTGNRREFVDVRGEHYTMLANEHVNSFARKLRASMKRATQLSLSNPLSPSIGRRRLDFHEVPTIDFSLTAHALPKYLEQLQYALEDVGFGVFVNVPGFDDEFQQEIFALADQLFRKPQEWKDALGTAKSYALRGYFRADNIEGPNKAHAEAYRFGLDLPEPANDDDSPVPFWLRLHEGPNQWPPESDLSSFRERMETLFDRYHSLNIILNKHICRLLDVPEALLDDYYPEKAEFNSAIWHYLPVTPEIRASARDGFVQGMHEHRDPSTFLTCLIQSRPGLQVQNHRGDWIDVPLVKGGVVCNIGMQLMRLTGGKFVATTHRVNTLKIEKDRYTIPYVMSTKLDRPIVPLPQFASTDIAKMHVQPNPKILKLMSIEDPLVRSGYARLSLFPAASRKLYPKEFEEARHLGVV